MKRSKTSDFAEHELEFARSRILKNLEEGQSLLNRMRGHPPCIFQNLLRMRSSYSKQHATIRKPAERLRFLLAEDQFVYVWNYSLVLLSNLGLQFRPGHEGTEIDHLESTLAASIRARKLYVQGRLGEAAALVTRTIDGLKLRIESDTPEPERWDPSGVRVRGGPKNGRERLKQQHAKRNAYEQRLKLLRQEHPFWKKTDLVAEAARYFGVSPQTIQTHTKVIFPAWAR